MSISKTFVEEDVWGKLRMRKYDVTLDSSYPTGGYTSALNFSPGAFGFSKILGIIQEGGGGASTGSVMVRFDKTNTKLLAFRTAPEALPQLIVEETVTVSSNAGTLTYPPAYIITAEATTGGTTGSLRIVPTGETVPTKSVAVTFTTGALAFLSTDAVTQAKFSYIPLGVGPFIEANRVVDEAKTAAANTFDFTNRAALIQYVWNDTGNTLPTLIPVGESPSSGQIAIDINNSTATTVTTNAAQGTNNFKSTYWKFSAIGLPYGWTDQADISVTSDAVAFTETEDTPGILIPGFGNVIVGETGGGNNLQSIMLGPSGSTAANVAVFNIAKNKLSFANGDSYGTIEIPYIIFNAAQMYGNAGVKAGQQGFEEVANGTNLSAVQVRLMFIGR